MIRVTGSAAVSFWRMGMARVAMVILLAVGCTTATGPARRAAEAPVSGYYEGTISSRNYGEVPISANLRDDGGAIGGMLITRSAIFRSPRSVAKAAA
jgi:hypothetical protein